MNKVKQLNILYNGNIVGKMALYRERLATFEYSKEWLQEGFSISPFSLPLERKVFIPKIDPFEGMFGVFADSLPDGWGRLLVDRLLLKNKLNPMEIDSMNRLAIVADSGMGALSYEPEHSFHAPNQNLDLDKIAQECNRILKTEYSENLDELFRLGGSSGGARPKILTNVEDEAWLIKFPSSGDAKNIGEQEYRYSLCAKKCGIEMEKTKLFSSNVCGGYFGTRRFDRKKMPDGTWKRLHMISAAAILETTHRIPNLDYNILMKLTLTLTKDFAEVEKMFRLMCFNVFAHNRDDHSKNFTYLYEEEKAGWRLSPAYDLTYSTSIGGEHATTVNGNGKNPGFLELIQVAKNIGMAERKAKSIADEIKECILAELKDCVPKAISDF